MGEKYCNHDPSATLGWGNYVSILRNYVSILGKKAIQRFHSRETEVLRRIGGAGPPPTRQDLIDVN